MHRKLEWMVSLCIKADARVGEWKPWHKSILQLVRVYINITDHGTIYVMLLLSFRSWGHVPAISAFCNSGIWATSKPRKLRSTC